MITSRMLAYFLLHNGPFGLELLAGVLLGQENMIVGILILAFAGASKVAADILYFSVMRSDVIRPEVNNK